MSWADTVQAEMGDPATPTDKDIAESFRELALFDCPVRTVQKNFKSSHFQKRPLRQRAGDENKVQAKSARNGKKARRRSKLSQTGSKPQGRTEETKSNNSSSPTSHCLPWEANETEPKQESGDWRSHWDDDDGDRRMRTREENGIQGSASRGEVNQRSNDQMISDRVMEKEAAEEKKKKKRRRRVRREDASQSRDRSLLLI
ncbi:uncharacterized protein [Diadema setosum]